MITNPRITRRSFIIGSAAVGGGLALGLRLPPFGPAQVLAADGTPEINAWVVIKPDDTVVIRVARSEMGQGTITGLAQLVAEELECDWKKVTTEYPTPGESVKRKRVWGDFSTGGSRGIRTSHEYVRKGGAAARMMLVQAAADQWGVAASECRAANSVITHAPTKRRTTYGKVAAAAAKLAPPKDVKLKDPKEWKLIGKPVKRLDTANKVNGKQVYGFDLKLPGMLNAAIKECPVFGGKVKSFDAARVANLRGVKKVLQVGDSAVAVVADTWWNAKTALEQLPVVWDEGPNARVSSASIAETLKAGLDAEQAFVGLKEGDAKAALAGAAKRVEAVYAYPFQNHACMEPMNATARYTPDKCEVWVPTQDGEASFAAVLAASGLPADKCEVYKINLGGGFGRRGAFQDYVAQENAVFIECFMDELAEAAGQDPLEFRRKFMAKHPRNLAVLNAVAEGIGWAKPAPRGMFRGIAQMKAFNSFVAAACEISVKDGNKVKVHRIVAATDCGYAVNPAQIERQVSGSFVYGLSALFMQECTVKDGAIEQKNFDNYQSMRIAQMPKVETIILQGGGDAWGGIGEPTICVAAPAVLNAFHKATGRRIRTVPLKNHGIELV